VKPTIRSFDLAHLAHVELRTPTPDESLRFFVDVMGLTESGRRGESVYLRGWDDYEHHTLKLTASTVAGMGHFAFRATSPEALERRVGVIERSGLGKGWTDGDLGHGPAYAFTTPDGHGMEVYYETEWYAPPPERTPSLKNQAMRFPARGINARRLDHLNLLTVDVAAMQRFMEDVVGMRTTEMIQLDNGDLGGVWVTATQKTYDVAFTADHYGAHGRFHHMTYAVDSKEEVLRAADICLEHGVRIETGPHKHAVQQTFFLYVYEPGGNRIEVDCSGARLMLAPDGLPVVWTETERKKGQAWGLKTVESFHSYGTPPIEQYTGPRGKAGLPGHAGPRDETASRGQ
jgi:catechol 2,3-dioxygenase